MIGYVILQNNNEIIAIVNDVVKITPTAVEGLIENARGINTNDAEIICIENAETKIVDEEIVPLEYGDILLTEGLNNQTPKFIILSELEELDLLVTRQSERIYIDTNTTPTYQPVVDAIARKVYLREQLNLLV